jgi:hypothetical protein
MWNVYYSHVLWSCKHCSLNTLRCPKALWTFIVKHWFMLLPFVMTLTRFSCEEQNNLFTLPGIESRLLSSPAATQYPVPTPTGLSKFYDSSRILRRITCIIVPKLRTSGVIPPVPHVLMACCLIKHKETVTTKIIFGDLKCVLYWRLKCSGMLTPYRRVSCRRFRLLDAEDESTAVLRNVGN